MSLKPDTHAKLRAQYGSAYAHAAGMTAAALGRFHPHIDAVYAFTGGLSIASESGKLGPSDFETGSVPSDAMTWWFPCWLTGGCSLPPIIPTIPHGPTSPGELNCQGIAGQMDCRDANERLMAGETPNQICSQFLGGMGVDVFNTLGQVCLAACMDETLGACATFGAEQAAIDRGGEYGGSGSGGGGTGGGLGGPIS